MNTSKYSTQARRDIKLDQRSPAYRELQRRSAEERAKLEATLRERNAVILRLKKKLLDVGCPAADVEQIAA